MSEFYVGDEVQVIKSKFLPMTIAMCGNVVSLRGDRVGLELGKNGFIYFYDQTELRLVKRSPYYLWHVMAREICGGNEQ